MIRSSEAMAILWIIYLFTHTHINATVVCPKFGPTGVERPRREPKLLPLRSSTQELHSGAMNGNNGKERRREILANRQSKRVGVYRRHMVWMTVGLSTVPREKRGKIEILSQQLRIAYAIIFQPYYRPLDLGLILYTTGGAIEEYDAIHLYYKQGGS